MGWGRLFLASGLVGLGTAAMLLAGGAEGSLPRTVSYDVGTQPLNVVAAGGRLWTENYGDGTVSIVDPVTRKTTSVRIGGQPGGIAYGAGSVWVSDLGGGDLVRLSLAGKVLKQIRLGGRGAGIAVDRGVVYVADYDGGLTRVDAATNRVVGRTKLGGQPEAVAAGFGRIWVTNGDGTVSSLHLRSGVPDGKPVAVGADADDVSIGRGAVWAVALYGKRLARIDPRSHRITWSLGTRGQASGVLATERAIWISYYDLGIVARVDPVRRRFVATYRVGLQPRSLAVLGGSIWVANQASNSISRITP